MPEVSFHHCRPAAQAMAAAFRRLRSARQAGLRHACPLSRPPGIEPRQSRESDLAWHDEALVSETGVGTCRWLHVIDYPLLHGRQKRAHVPPVIGGIAHLLTVARRRGWKRTGPMLCAREQVKPDVVG